MRILIVDDDKHLRILLSSCLNSIGQCETANNGRIAIEKFIQAYTEGNPYSFITMDNQMPVLDGLCAINTIRSFEISQKSRSPITPICIVSADEDCLEIYEQQYGKDSHLRYLPKPFRVQDLVSIAQLTLHQQHSTETQ